AAVGRQQHEWVERHALLSACERPPAARGAPDLGKSVVHYCRTVEVTTRYDQHIASGKRAVCRIPPALVHVAGASPGVVSVVEDVGMGLAMAVLEMMASCYEQSAVRQKRMPATKKVCVWI